VGGRESQNRRKKTPLPSWVRPTARKPSPTSRSGHNRHDNRRDSREPQRDRNREREQPNHGPHFLDRFRFRKKDNSDVDRSREPQRGTGSSVRRSDKAGSNVPSEKNGPGWRRFFLLMFLLACGTAYTFYATMNVPRDGDASNHSQSEKDPSPDTSASTPSNAGETVESRTSERSSQRTETRPTGESSRETSPRDTQNQDIQNSDDPPGLRTQEWRTLPEQEADSHIASSQSRDFQQLNHTEENTSPDERPLPQ